MKTLKKQISLFGEDKLTSLQEVSRANLTHQQAKDLAQRMTATSGQRCVVQSERFVPELSWRRMFLASLVGMEDWYSTKCKLTWKIKATKYNQLYFQLAPSTHPTEETGFGLLLTPTTIERAEHPDKMRERVAAKGYKNGTKYGSLTSQLLYKPELKELFPTPTAVQRDHPERVVKLKESGATTMMSRAAGENRPNSILDAAMFYGMLPTPNASDHRDRGGPSNPCIKKRMENGKQVGLTMTVDGQLNPRFVGEMMGYPPNWLELPYQDTEKKV